MHPVLTKHARERCEQMELPHRLAKAIWVRRSCVYPDPSHGVRVIARSDDFPGYAVVVDPSGEAPVIVTILFDCRDRYVRRGATFEVTHP